MRPQTRVRKMRQRGRHHDPAIRAARRAGRRQATNEQEPQS